jgi:hypothetical protein
MVDFSYDYNSQYFIETIKNPETNEFRLQAKELMAKTEEFNDLFLCLPETYDLALRSFDFNTKYLKYGLFLAYLDEFYLRAETKINSRYIFSIEEVEKWYQMFDSNFYPVVREKFLAYPFIPHRKNCYINTFIYKHQPSYPEIFQHPKVNFNINGSTVLNYLNNIESDDIDIRIDYQDSDKLVSNEDFDSAVKDFAKAHKIKMIKVELNNGNYKYKGGNYDIYRASFGFISNYHVPPVRINYNGRYQLYPSAIIAILTGICVDIRYFTVKNDEALDMKNPMTVIEKYHDRDFTFFLNDKEMALLVEYLTKKSLIFSHYVPLVLRTNDFEEYMKDFFENNDVETYEQAISLVPKKYHQQFLRQQMYLQHNRIMNRKHLYQVSDHNLLTPF